MTEEASIYDAGILLRAKNHVLNAGVDVNDYRPVTFEEMVENNRKFKAAHA